MVDPFEDENDEAADDAEDDDETDTVAQRLSKKDRLLSDGTAALSKAQIDWAPEKHASKVKATKQVQRAILNIRKWGRSNGAIDNSEQNQQLSAQLFNFADAVEDRQSFLESCGNDFQATVLSPMSIKHQTAAASFPAGILCNLVTKGAQSLSDAALTCPSAANSLMAALSTEPAMVLQVPESEVKGFGIATALKHFQMKKDISYDEQTSINDLIVASQNAALLNHLEKIYKIGEMKKFITAAGNITTHMEKVKLEDLVSVFKNLPGSGATCKSEDAFWLGFNPQLHIDLIATRVKLMVAICKQDATKIPRDLALAASSVAALSSKVSPRLRCYHSGIGFKSNPVKVLWKVIDGLQSAIAAAPRSLDTTAAIDFTARLKKAKALGEAMVLAELLSEVIEGDNTDVLKLLIAHGDESDNPGDKAVADDFVAALLGALEALIKSQQFFADILRDFVQIEDETETQSAIGAGTEVAENWKDPDNHPENIALCVLVKLGLEMVSQSSHQVYSVVCGEACNRISTHIEAWFIIHTRMSCLEQFRQLTTLHREDAWLRPNCAPRPEVGELCNEVQIMIDKFASTPRLSFLINQVLAQAVYEGGSNSVAISRDCHGLDGSLPKTCHPIIRTLRAFEYAEDLAGKISSGRGSAVTIAELNEGLSELHFGKHTLPLAAERRDGFKKNEELIQKEFDVGFDGLCKKLSRVQASMKVLDNKCSGVYSACDSWNFSGDSESWAFATKQNPDKVLLDAAKNIEHFVTQYESIKGQVMRLTATTKHMTEGAQAQLLKLAKDFEDQSLKASLDKSVKLLAHVYIVSALFQGTVSQENENKDKHFKSAAKWLDHIQRVLQFHPSGLHSTLAKHVIGSGDASSGKKGAATPSLASTVATLSDDPATIAGSSSSRANDAEASGKHSQEPAKKKLKSFGNATTAAAKAAANSE